MGRNRAPLPMLRLHPLRCVASSSSNVMLRALSSPHASHYKHAALRALSSSHANYSKSFGDHSWRQQNHIWTEGEILERMATANVKHLPQSFPEAVLQKAVRAAYHI